MDTYSDDLVIDLIVFDPDKQPLFDFALFFKVLNSDDVMHSPQCVAGAEDALEKIGANERSRRREGWHVGRVVDVDLGNWDSG